MSVYTGHITSPSHPEDSDPASLGSERFRTDFGVRMPYMVGAMYKAISSVSMVTECARAGILVSYGTGGLTLAEARDGIRQIRAAAGSEAPFAVSYMAPLNHPEREVSFVDMLLAENVKLVEAGAFIEVTDQLIRYRAMGLHRSSTGEIIPEHKVIAKLSHPEVARQFVLPPKQRRLDRLVAEEIITPEQADLVVHVPLADAITVEGDSGGHTDGAVLVAAFPAIARLVRSLEMEVSFPHPILMGAAGGLGCPESIAAAFAMGADYVVTGSINQCTHEAGTSDLTKELLASLSFQDTRKCIAGDMFEVGGIVQVVRRGLLFPARAQMLHDVYLNTPSLEAMDPAVRSKLEHQIFKQPISHVKESVRRHVSSERWVVCERDPKVMLASVMKWYFARATRAAIDGDEDWRADLQIQCGPAMGAFNAWAQGTDLEDWRARGVVTIAERLMTVAAQYGPLAQST